MVDIYVGKEKTHFRVHKKLICDKSYYVSHTLSPDGPKIVEPNSITFEDIDKDGFDVMIRWLYGDDVKEHQSVDVWLEVYRIGETLWIRELESVAMGAIITHFKTKLEPPSSSHIKKILGTVDNMSPLWYFTMDLAAYFFLNEERWSYIYDDLLSDEPIFAFELAHAMHRLTSPKSRSGLTGPIVPDHPLYSISDPRVSNSKRYRFREDQ